MQDKNPEVFILPVVYIVPYPMPPAAFGDTANRIKSDTERQFALPYPEDDNDEAGR